MHEHCHLPSNGNAAYPLSPSFDSKTSVTIQQLHIKNTVSSAATTSIPLTSPSAYLTEHPLSPSTHSGPTTVIRQCDRAARDKLMMPTNCTKQNHQAMSHKDYMALSKNKDWLSSFIHRTVVELPVLEDRVGPSEHALPRKYLFWAHGGLLVHAARQALPMSCRHCWQCG